MEFFKKIIPEEHKNSSGIYKITNTVNGKIYIGKTINFRKRYERYKSAYKRRDVRHINQYFINSIEKYSPEKFTFKVIELCSSELLAEKELYWMEFYNSTNPDIGYNLRLDSSTGMITHEKTREKISKRMKMEFETGIRSRETVSQWAKNLWEDENKKAQMARNVAIASSRYRFYQYDKFTMELVRVWENMLEIMEANPDYHNIAIYSVCNGHKKSYKGYVWKKKEKN